MTLFGFKCSDFQLIAIGCSAGGFDLLNSILPRIQRECPASFVVIMHMAPDSPGYLAEIFKGRCKLNVKEAEPKEEIKPGYIYFAPPNYHLLVEPDHTFAISVDEPVNYSRPSIDVFFESAAPIYKNRMVGVIMSGANKDGANGLKSVVSCNGLGIVQDPETAEHPTMPRAALDFAKSSLKINIEDLAQWLSL